MRAKILVADDEEDLELLIKQKFRKQIRENKYEFVFVLNGNQALQKLNEETDFDLVLSDINMPEMDGLTLLSHLPDVSPLVKTVIVSAYGDMDNIRSAMNGGAFDFVCKPINFQDLELTIEKTFRHVLQLKDTLKAIKENNILRMYVDESVLNFMSRRDTAAALMTNEVVHVSVMFVDICSFTSITEKETPDKVVELLNNYFDVMVKEIIAHGGYVDKFIGDAVMAVFQGENHLDRATAASVAVCSQIEALPKENGNVAFTPHVAVGINSGEVISGNIGSATLKRLDYTIIGDVVNTAQRLQSAAQPGQILMSEANSQNLGKQFTTRLVGEKTLKNKSGQIVVYEVVY